MGKISDAVLKKEVWERLSHHTSPHLGESRTLAPNIVQMSSH